MSPLQAHVPWAAAAALTAARLPAQRCWAGLSTFSIAIFAIPLALDSPGRARGGREPGCRTPCSACGLHT